MIVNVVGVRRGISFTTPDNKVINGTNLYISYSDQEHGVEGYKCERIFVNSTTDTSFIKVPCKIEILYNRYGKVETLRLCDK